MLIRRIMKQKTINRPRKGCRVPPTRMCRSRLLCVAALVLQAQAVDLRADTAGGIGDTGRLKSEQQRVTPSPLPSADEDRDFVLPPIDEPSRTGTVGSGVKFHLRAIHVKGATAIDADTINQACKEFIGRDVTIDDLNEIRDRITRLYIDAGYINSGAVLPDQEIADGEVSYQVVEGHLDETTIHGLVRVKESYVRQRLAKYDQTPLDVNRLNMGLLMLRDNPLFSHVAARLNPGEALGSATLDVSVTEAKPYEVQIAVDNHRNPSIGANQATVSLVHRNLTGAGDTATVDYSITSGSDQYAVSYARPLSADDAVIRAYYQDSESQVIESAFRDVGIETRGDTGGVEVSYPLQRNINTQNIVGLSVEHERTRTYFLGVPFSFTPGVINGRAEVTRVNLFNQWSHRTSKQAYAVRNTLIVGTDWLGATVHDRGPDSRYTALHTQAQGVRLLSPFARLVGRMDLFYSNDELLSSEKSAIGGAYSVRGYRDSVLVEERTLTASLEYRHRVAAWTSQQHQWEWAIFADAGMVDSTDTPTPNPRSIASAGVGLLYHYMDHLDATAYLAAPTHHIEQSDEALADKGIHLEMVMRW